MMFNHTTFFSYIRKAPFGGRLTQDQVEGTKAIITEFYNTGAIEKRHLAYILATAFHETGGRMVPVRESFAKSDSSARKKLAKYKYAQPDPVTGHAYYGRGHVQLTWADNYKRMGDILGLDLYNKPDLALEKDVSARILVEGMLRGESGKGDFTNKSLDQYFNDEVDDPEGARRIVNGKDKAVLIAGYYHNFLDAIEHAAQGTPPADVKPKDALPDKPNLFTDKTTLGAVSAVAGSGIFGAFTAIDSVWAFAAFAVVALGIFLFATGRVQIIRRAGA